jgi:hypothetical protein
MRSGIEGRAWGLVAAAARWVWGLTWPTAHVRVGLAIIMLGGGLIRVVDGRLFQLSPLAYGSDLVYGVTQLCVGLFLLVSWRERCTLLGQIAAALGCALYLWLMAGVAGTSSISAYNAAVFAAALFFEARAWQLRDYR